MIDILLFKAQLDAEKIRIIKDLQHIAVFDTATEDWVAIPDAEELGVSDDNNEADAIETWNERQAIVAALETTFNDIERALTKITTGTYATCEVGGETIELERLAVLPTARTCTAHMEHEDLLSL